jgi:Polysaccharide deacetylase
MIVLTGDVHHRSLNTNDQRRSDLDEVAASERYLEIADHYGLSVTLFVTGRTAIEHSEGLARLSGAPNLEIAGHTFNAYKLPFWKRPLRRLSRSAHGFRSWQQAEIEATRRALVDVAGHPITSWRNHAYLSDRHTPELLRAAGIRVWSDQVDPTAMGPQFGAEGLVELPINVMPDHEHLYHAHRTVSWVSRWQRRYHFSDGFGSESYAPQEWADQVAQQALRISNARGVATILAHPLCQYVADGLRAFDSLCRQLRDCQSTTASAAPVKGGTP